MQLNKKKPSKVKKQPKAKVKKQTKARVNKQAKANASSNEKNKPDQSICVQATVPVDDSGTVAQLVDTLTVGERDAQVLLHGAARDQQTPGMRPLSAAVLQEQVNLLHVDVTLLFSSQI